MSEIYNCFIDIYQFLQKLVVCKKNLMITQSAKSLSLQQEKHKKRAHFKQFTQSIDFNTSKIYFWNTTNV